MWTGVVRPSFARNPRLQITHSYSNPGNSTASLHCAITPTGSGVSPTEAGWSDIPAHDSCLAKNLSPSSFCAADQNVADRYVRPIASAHVESSTALRIMSTAVSGSCETAVAPLNSENKLT